MLSPVLLVLTSLSLSTDAFAAALARGASHPGARTPDALRTGTVFGLSEGLMCLAGWSLAQIAEGWIAALDHWIALILLGVIGSMMIRNGISGGDDDAESGPARATLVGTVVTALGTSIDAAAVGVALAVSGGPVWTALMVGLSSFLIASLGYRIGPRVGEKLGGWAEIAGGTTLILIGVSIFISHVTAG